MVLKISTLAIGIQHIEANKALFLFWEQLLTILTSTGQNILPIFLNTYGSAFVFNLLKEVQSVCNNIIFEYILDVLLQLVDSFALTVYHTQVVAWFTHSL